MLTTTSQPPGYINPPPSVPLRPNLHPNHPHIPLRHIPHLPNHKIIHRNRALPKPDPPTGQRPITRHLTDLLEERGVGAYEEAREGAARDWLRDEEGVGGGVAGPLWFGFGFGFGLGLCGSEFCGSDCDCDLRSGFALC